LLLAAVTAHKHLFFKDGKFLIAQFTDMHYGEDEFTPWGPIQDVKSDHVMHVVLRIERPDFVLFTGDVLTGNNINSNATEYWKYVVSPCVQADTPWTHVFGNHDDLSQSNGSREDLLAFDMQYNLSHTLPGYHGLPGVSNYVLHIRNEAGFVAGLIMVMDSGGGQLPEQITTDQLEWFRAEWEMSVNIHGHVPVVVTFHIPIPEYEILYNTQECTGHLNNTILPLDSAGTFEMLDSIEDIVLVTTGHYHENDFCCSYNNPKSGRDRLFCSGRHSGYGGYGHDVDRGARMIELTHHSVKTWIRMEDGSSMYPMEVTYPKGVLENMALNQVY